ncbi:hypothetical protein [Streptomyces sp. S.PB5]|uniref:hypothetical protein n=1 Tax=Streptomyces sp. S.PB5 TaxID=3020844 RepID=UPI0025B0DB9E|nr:hypothetical protein [Streptomyces sp. S.PB5]MDN3028142.1 hypothetical protein [Streptomyces sp. S.PB5]
MGRVLRVVVFLGILFALLPAVPAAAAPCEEGNLSDRLKCWTGRLDDDPVTLSLDRALPLEGDKETRAKIIKTIEEHSDKLAVQVPAGVSTGEGGTVLLILAKRENRLVDPDARIDRLQQSTHDELTTFCTEPRKSLCDDLVVQNGKQDPVSGQELISSRRVIEHRSYVADAAENKGSDFEKWLLPATATLLALLLTVFVLVVRRTRTAPATASTARIADEPTRALRTTPARIPRARSATRTGPTHPAVVRTDLHPQGYVELDRVLYRAVWAEPGQAAPPPGSRVDVADGPDQDLLYAFPPAAGRHAHAR